jgi:hypothetical protein
MVISGEAGGGGIYPVNQEFAGRDRTVRFEPVGIEDGVMRLGRPDDNIIHRPHHRRKYLERQRVELCRVCAGWELDVERDDREGVAGGEAVHADELVLVEAADGDNHGVYDAVGEGGGQWRMGSAVVVEIWGEDDVLADAARGGALGGGAQGGHVMRWKV